MDDWITNWSKFIMSIFTYLLIESYLSILRACGYTSVSSGSQSGKIRISTILFQASHSPLRPRIDLINSLLANGLKSIKRLAFGRFELREYVNYPFLWAWILYKKMHYKLLDKFGLDQVLIIEFSIFTSDKSFWIQIMQYDLTNLNLVSIFVIESLFRILFNVTIFTNM